MGGSVGMEQPRPPFPSTFLRAWSRGLLAHQKCHFLHHKYNQSAIFFHLLLIHNLNKRIVRKAILSLILLIHVLHHQQNATKTRHFCWSGSSNGSNECLSSNAKQFWVLLQNKLELKTLLFSGKQDYKDSWSLHRRAPSSPLMGGGQNWDDLNESARWRRESEKSRNTLEGGGAIFWDLE